MNRNNSPRQSMMLPQRFGQEQDEKGRLNAIPSSHKQSCGRKRRLFVFTKTGVLPTTTGPGRQIHRILIFDDHPDSLRLILGGSACRETSPIAQKRISARSLIFPALALIVALLTIVWPLL
jgi:hypothetical protein